EHLRHALDLTLAPHDGVELVLLGELGQVAAEVVEDGGLALLCWHVLSLASGAGAAAATAFFGRPGAGGGLSADDRTAFGSCGGVGGRESLLEDLRGDVLVVAEQAQQQVLGPNHVALVELGLEVGDLEHRLGLLRERDVADGEGAAGGAHGVLDGLLQLEEVAPEVAEDLHGDPLAFADDAEEEVFGADVVVPEPDGFLPAVGDDVADSVGEVAFHQFGVGPAVGAGRGVARRRRRSRSRRSGWRWGCRRRSRARRGRRGSPRWYP